MNRFRKLIALGLVLGLLTVLAPGQARAAAEPYAQPITVDGEKKTVLACEGSYAGNLYLSLTDLAAALQGTDRQFRFERVVSSTDGEYFTILTGQTPLLPSGAENAPEKADPMTLNLMRNRLLVDGEERRYYTHKTQNGDLFMSIIDVQLLLNLTVGETAEGSLQMDLKKPFAPVPKDLELNGYFEDLDSVYLAEAESGRLLYSYHSRETLPVASLTKLLSYLVLKEGIDAGEISEKDKVVISDQAEALSRSMDGMVPMQAGQEVPFTELMEGMLLASSNECALALAEHLCGSEGAFVRRMQNRAKELELSTATIRNCSGLPSYGGGMIPVKRQNCMSAEDLFRLCQEVLSRYPEITEITSKRLTNLKTLNDYWTANSNPLVFNMQGVNGLKTGSTARAGYCVAASMAVEAEDGGHTLVLVLLGAESPEVRGQAAEMLLRYGAARIQSGG